MRAKLEYQRIIPGKRVGRYICPKSTTLDDLCDICDTTEVEIQNARLTEASWNTAGFQLLHVPTKIQNFGHDEVSKVYYPEVEHLLKTELERAGSKVERVIAFDHTIRSSSASNLNTLGAKEAVAGPATRVHADYDELSAPRRLQQLANQPGYTGIQLMPADVDRVLSSRQRFALINVWRSIDPDHPVLQCPLALCDPGSVDEKDCISYEMVYPDRIGSRFALTNTNSSRHNWYYYPEMTMDECLMFTCYDRRPDGPRFVFHCAFDDGNSTDIPRQSIEVRTIIIFDEFIE